jgi:outer membrane protein assembly factor BamB
MATGREQWANAWDAEFQEAMGGDGPRATPTWNEGRVYALGATGELRCLDAATGKRIWSRNILKDNHAENLTWGMSAAPLIVDEKVIVLPGGTAGQSVAAYNKLTGEPIWKALDDKQAYTSPMLVTLAGKRQILVVSGKRIMGLTVENGSLIWEYPWTTEYDINSAQPLVLDENRVFISAGYGHGSAVLEITPAGVKSIWANNRMKNKFSSSVLYEGNIYGLDEAILACINTETGELKWKGGRYGYGQLLLAGGNLVVTTETGDVVLVKATPESHQELARFHAVSGKTWNNPAISDGLLLVRNETEMACFRLKF